MGAILKDITERGKVAKRRVWENRMLQKWGSDEGKVRVGRSGEKGNRNRRFVVQISKLYAI